LIRLATEDDIPRIIELGARSLEEGPYKDQIGEPVKGAELALNLIQSQNGTVLLYVEKNKTLGLLAFFIYPHYFSGEITANELMWYVEPEARRGKSFGDFPALKLLREAERIAKESGAKRMTFVAPTNGVAKMYERLGYKPIETSYQRTL